MRSEQSWSVLDPRPCLLYLAKHDEYIVYWNGWAMTHSQALCMAVETFGIYPTPEMKQAMQRNYEKIYYANGFQTREWDRIVENGGGVYDYQKTNMRPHVKLACENKTPQDILEWFNYKRARIEE